MPVSYYSDEDRWNREIEFIFKKKPIILALSCELADPNSYKAVKRIGLPILLTRDGDGKVRGFINACRHRGAILTGRSEEHTSELQSIMRISYAVFCLNNKPTEN